MISLEEAHSKLLDGVEPLGAEIAALTDACDRFLAQDVIARLTQPPFPASSMDGYAIRFADLPGPWLVIGKAAAGANFANTVEPGQAVRIFTGAPVPDDADTVLIQEAVARDGNEISLAGEGPLHRGAHVRRAGLDFAEGKVVATAGSRVTAATIGLLAAAGHGTAAVRRRPRVALIVTGNELVPPGETPGPSQIVNANGPMLAALFSKAGADVIHQEIVRDDADALLTAIHACADANILLTVGGVSVGDHDLVVPALQRAGAAIDFWKVALRPGKPMLTGRLGATRVLGLPGNPVSAYVCAVLFGVPLVRALSGDPAPLPRTAVAIAAVPLPANGPRREFMRATLADGGVTPAAMQDSAMLAILAASNCLLVRPPHAPPVAAGEQVVIIPLDSDSYGP